MNFNNSKVSKVPGGGAASSLVKVGNLRAFGLYGAANSLYNVDGGHRAILFNRIYGIKDKARLKCVARDLLVLFKSFKEMNKNLELIENQISAISIDLLEIKEWLKAVLESEQTPETKKSLSLLMVVMNKKLELIENNVSAISIDFLEIKRLPKAVLEKTPETKKSMNKLKLIESKFFAISTDLLEIKELCKTVSEFAKGEE